ncbi:MAG: hypothetical protein ACPGYV_07265 [Phycisphaeraceae bacterium]
MKLWQLFAGMLTLTLCLGLAQAAEDTKTAINDKCPISEQPINAEKTSDYKVEFCCNNCKGKFEKNPGAYMDKVAAAEPGTCIFNGRAAKVSTTLTVGFCCGNCKGKFDENPKKYIGKVKPAEKDDA